VKRLLYAITFTTDISELKRFYRDAIGLTVADDGPVFVSFGSEHAGLALLAVRRGQSTGMELCFETASLAADVESLRGRGVTVIKRGKTESFGEVAHFRDPDGNLLSLLDPAQSHEPMTPPADAARFTGVILNTRDMTAMKKFYRATLHLPSSVDSPWWVQFDAGGAMLALHPRAVRGVREQHHTSPITIAFAAPDLTAWADVARESGLSSLGEVGDEGWGPRAEAVDPEGNALAFSELPDEPTLEETLAEPFEDDVPHQAAMRKPIKKASKALSRLVVKPDYKPTKSGRHKAVETMKRARRAASTRGAGPAGTRLQPKRAKDTKRAKNKPAIGRREKAERRVFEVKRTTVAQSSKGKPVKRAAKAGRRVSSRVGSPKAARSGARTRASRSR
jgi:predicted enzyme related to lactoylglutathione lyase